MQVIVLNADYSFLTMASWQDAVCLLYKGAAESVKSDILKRVRSVSQEIVVTAIIRLVKFVRRNFKKKVPWSKRAVYLRDNYVCQYTGKKLKPNEATIDHVVPRARGGKSTFENCVTCSKDLNHRKGDKSLEECGLHLIKQPKEPTINEFMMMQINQLGIAGVLKEYGLL